MGKEYIIEELEEEVESLKSELKENWANPGWFEEQIKTVKDLIKIIKECDNSTPIVVVSGGVVDDVIGPKDWVLVDWDNIKGC